MGVRLTSQRPYICAFARSFHEQFYTDLIRLERRTLCICKTVSSIDKKISITINNRGKKMIKKDNKFLGRTLLSIK